MRKALLVGINDYAFAPLNACIPDAMKMANILSKNDDASPNFHCRVLTSDKDIINKEDLSNAILELYEGEPDIALFYFSGHGSEQTRTNEACLVTQDAKNFSEGVQLGWLLAQLKASKAKEKIVILDCCFSGNMGSAAFINEDFSFLPEGTSILTSSHKSQVSFENPDGGVFTNIVCNALDGGGADTLGYVNLASIYAYADKLLGPWDQRPIFKAYVSKMSTIRKCKPLVPFEILRKLPIHFSKEDYVYPLDPTFEPDAEPKGHPHEEIFFELQALNRASLLIPNDEEHMYYAAINSKSCSLTPLGKYYWKLAKDNML